jgi:hypothetical protein
MTNSSKGFIRLRETGMRCRESCKNSEIKKTYSRRKVRPLEEEEARKKQLSATLQDSP